jgi:hypothetical protein
LWGNSVSAKVSLLAAISQHDEDAGRRRQMDNQPSKVEIRSHVENLRKMWGGPISEAELSFLRDVQGFIEFCIRNGLSFLTVATTLGHDINGLARNGFVFPPADGFLPKVTGYFEVNAADVGDPNAEESA